MNVCDSLRKLIYHIFSEEPSRHKTCFYVFKYLTAAFQGIVWSDLETVKLRMCTVCCNDAMCALCCVHHNNVRPIPRLRESRHSVLFDNRMHEADERGKG